jgi:hypothetical protein
MYCKCCRGRNFWLSEKEIAAISCQELEEQAMQAIEFYGKGVNIHEQGLENAFIYDMDTTEDFVATTSKSTTANCPSSLQIKELKPNSNFQENAGNFLNFTR